MLCNCTLLHLHLHLYLHLPRPQAPPDTPSMYCISSRQQHRRLVLVLVPVDAAKPPASLRPRAASSLQHEIPAIEVERRGSHGLSSSTWILDSTNSTTHILRVLAKSPPAILPPSLQHNLSSAQGLIRTLPALSGHLSDTAIPTLCSAHRRHHGLPTPRGAFQDSILDDSVAILSKIFVQLSKA